MHFGIILENGEFRIVRDSHVYSYSGEKRVGLWILDEHYFHFDTKNVNKHKLGAFSLQEIARMIQMEFGG